MSGRVWKIVLMTGKVVTGGFSMDAATALYSTACFTVGKNANGSPYPIHLKAVVSLSGWLPGSRSLRNIIESSKRKAASLPIYICHGTNVHGRLCLRREVAAT